MGTSLDHRITSLERWGMRGAHDFQARACRYVAEAGYTGVLVNGGSGFGPDMMTPESLVQTETIPDLMPLTHRGNLAEIRRRCTLLKEVGLAPWLCAWGVPGPDQSADSGPAESNRFFDRRTKLEMTACMRRQPELFGRRKPTALSWRGNRPLCISNRQVQAFYRELYGRIVEAVPELAGVFYFPGDGAEPECCDDTCPRCSQSGRDAWARMFDHVNDIYSSLQSVRPGLPMTFAVWNQDHARGQSYIGRFLDELDPGIGIAMSVSDNAVGQRPHTTMRFNQPWSLFAGEGELFRWMHDRAHGQGRSVMVMGEVSQSEVWDPACHNVPTPQATLQLLRRSEALPAVDSMLDFWGNRRPFMSHANHAVMRQWLASPGLDDETLLWRAAAQHYAVEVDSPLARQGTDCWQAWTDALDDWALCTWCQRFSYAVGRDAARGGLYGPLIPQYLRRRSWALRQIENLGPGPDELLELQRADRTRWLDVADRFRAFGDALETGGSARAEVPRREAGMVDLAAELIVSHARCAAAMQAYQSGQVDRLRRLVLEEIDAREHQLLLSGRLDAAAGVNPVLVGEDIQLMRLFVSCDDFPDVPDDIFHMTATPYSV